MSRNKLLVRIGIGFAIISIVYFLGPKSPALILNNKLPHLNFNPTITEQNIIARESRVKNIKPNNESHIIWNDSILKNKTPYCIVYLHGFSASSGEGSPVHKDIARKFGCNLYLPRLYAHGLNEKEPMLELDEEKYLNSAKEAVAEAMCLGEKVIIMATSTGGTFALYLAAGNPAIAGLILYSPNVDLHDPRSFLLIQHWGLQLARIIVGSKYYSIPGPAGTEKYWTSNYRIEALMRMKNMLVHTMKPEIFEAIKQPVLVCYYYKNKAEQDHIVSVPAMLKMFDELGTDTTLKRKVAIPGAGTHVIASGLWSKDINSVEHETISFLEEKMNMKTLE